MILVWHNSQYLEFEFQELLCGQPRKEVLVDNLTPVAWVNTSELALAWQLTLNTNGSLPNLPRAIALTKNSRSTTVGDVLQQADGESWLITSQGYNLLQIQLLYNNNGKHIEPF